MEEISDIQIWILSGVLGFFLSLSLILFSYWISTQKRLSDAIYQLKEELVKEREQLKTLFNNQNDHKAELKDLDDRVYKIEIKQARNENNKELHIGRVNQQPNRNSS